MDGRWIHLFSSSIGLWILYWNCISVQSNSEENRCPFERKCTCSNPTDDDRKVFEWAKCEFKDDKDNPTHPQLAFKEFGGKYTVSGELLISGDFTLGFTIGINPMGKIFESVGHLTLDNKAKKRASLAEKVKPTALLGLKVATLELRGFRQLMESFNRFRSGRLQDTTHLILKKALLHDYNHQGISLFRGFPKLTALTIEESFVKALAPNGFDPLKDQLTELTIAKCELTQYPTLEKLTKLTMLSLQDNTVKENADKGCMFCSLTELKELHLRGYDMKISISSGSLAHLPNPTLTVFLTHGSMKAIQELPEEVTASLPRLSVANNEIITVTSDDFHMHCTLTYLCLDSNPLEAIEAGATRNLYKLEELDIRHTEITTFDLSILSNKMKSLKTLNLDHNPLLTELTASDLEQIPPNLAHISLTHVILDEINPDLEELVTRENFELLDISDTLITHCDEVRWLIIHAMCEEDVRVKVERTQCGNAEGKLFTDYMKKPAKRLCTTVVKPPVAAAKAAEVEDDDGLEEDESNIPQDLLDLELELKTLMDEDPDKESQKKWKSLLFCLHMKISGHTEMVEHSHVSCPAHGYMIKMVESGKMRLHKVGPVNHKKKGTYEIRMVHHARHVY